MHSYLLLIAIAILTQDQLSHPDDLLPWSATATVTDGTSTVVRFQACIASKHLIVRAVHDKGWHTYAMDNRQRAMKALQGKQSLGIEEGLQVKITKGATLTGKWLQTPPKDLSQPEMRWYTYGFEDSTYLACPIQQEDTPETVTLEIKGQACNSSSCRQVDLTLNCQAVQLESTQQRQLNEQIAKLLKELAPVIFEDSHTPGRAPKVSSSGTDPDMPD
ncbi:MAG: hypothetical protein KDB22_07215 [Planctomycetales bacterium]|nr:hypothetical protein [Planctomycetales bacterium]